ncbi:hypothetical protein ACIBJI_41170 [Nocardia sp. NPDC050408]|uniref:hypothetical protein n=1 Tax=Nocardia sp. NPDC050408 TaxID=3364319 RepID=UPI0037B5EB1E
MAFTTIEVAYRDDYNFGVGADMATGSPMGFVVDGTEVGVEHAGGASVIFEVRRITTTAELEQALGIDAKASFGSGLFGAGMSARFSYATSSSVQRESLFMAVTSRVSLQHLSIKAPKLTPKAAEMVDNPTVFAERYGNMFVRGMDRGGLFIGVFRLDVRSEQDRTAIAAKLQGSYGLFSASAATAFDEVRSTYHADALVSMYHEGGPMDLAITDLTKPSQLLDNANKWLQAFKNNPDENAVPYTVTLAPISIAEAPMPPNAADLQKAQDVLVICAEERSRIFDKINLLKYVVDHEDYYDWTGNPAPTTSSLNSAINGFEQDLDLISMCASESINHPSQALTPASFAQQQGKPYPAGAIPSPMPTPRALTLQVGGQWEIVESNGSHIKLVVSQDGDKLSAQASVFIFGPNQSIKSSGHVSGDKFFLRIEWSNGAIGEYSAKFTQGGFPPGSQGILQGTRTVVGAQGDPQGTAGWESAGLVAEFK